MQSQQPLGAKLSVADLAIPSVRVHLSKRFLLFAVFTSILSLGLIALLITFISRQYLLSIDSNGVHTHGGDYYTWGELTRLQQGAHGVVYLCFDRRKVIVLSWAVIESETIGQVVELLANRLADVGIR